MITPRQYQYLQALVEMCQEKSIELPEEVKDQLCNKQDLTVEEAAELIDNIKFELGWM